MIRSRAVATLGIGYGSLSGASLGRLPIEDEELRPRVYSPQEGAAGVNTTVYDAPWLQDGRRNRRRRREALLLLSTP